MPLEAKIASQTQGIGSAPVQAAEGSVSIAPGESIALNVQPSAVAGYSRDGGDLLVHLKSGELLRVSNFYVDPTKVSHLLLVQEEDLVAADLTQVAGSGIASASYVPMDALAGFTSPAATEAAGAVGLGAGAGASAAGLGLGIIVPVAALGGGGLLAMAVSSGGGNGSDAAPPTPPTPPDTTPPAAATNLAVSAAGDRLTGRAEAGATVSVDTDGNGTANYTATVGADGAFSVALSPPLANGETIAVTVRDAAGNTGPAASVVAPDITAPAPAANVMVAADGSGVTGTAEAGATVTIDGDGQPDYSATVGANGQFAIAFTPPLQNGEQIDVVVSDPAGNRSAVVRILAPDLVPPPATAPVVDPTDGTVLTGTAAGGVAVIVTDASGNTLGQAVIAADGSWTFTPQSPLPDGSVLNVAAINSEGQAGPGTIVTVDAVAPAAPVFALYTATEIGGAAEAGATVLLTAADGTAIGQAVASSSGAWTLTTATPLADGTVVVAVAKDAAGNTSIAASAIIDAVPPSIPTIAPPGATTISGTAEAGATVLLTDGAGDPIGQTIATAGGTWSLTPASPLVDGSIVIATARDAAGNLGPSASAIVDAVAPAAPILAPSNGTVLSGSAEPGATVLLTDGTGARLGQAMAGANGSWSFVPSSPLPDGTSVTASGRDAAGNIGASATITVDALAPSTPVIQPSAGVVLSGTAEPGSLVSVLAADGTLIGQAMTDGGGIWSLTPTPPLADGSVVTAQAQDAAGNTSGSASITIDAIAPSVPTLVPTSGVTISGTAEPGAVISLTGGDGSLIGRTTVDGNGDWSLTPSSPLPDGFVVNATAQDAAGNVSVAASTTVDGVAPVDPTIDPSNGAVLTGTAEAGAEVLLVDGNGDPLGEVTADGSGNWTFTPPVSLADGTTVAVTARDAAGNVSGSVSTAIDAMPPDPPMIDASNGAQVSGTAEAGAVITLTDDDGNLLGTTGADASGDWTFVPATPLPDGLVVHATAQDAAGNISTQASISVDRAAPATPVIDPTNGSALTGTAEAGSLLALTDGDGNAIGQVTVDGVGAWTFTPATPLPDGTVVNATAQDAAGNISATASTTVDAVAPVDPTINPTNGSVVTGTAEPDSTVVLMDGTGNNFTSFSTASAGTMSVFAASSNVPDLGLPIGEAAVDDDGNWIFIPLLPLPDGTVVIAVSVDAAGNVSGPVSTTVDGVAPNVPAIDPTAGLLLEGIAEPGVTIRLIDSLGNPIGETAADQNGGWSFAPATGLANGTIVEAIAVDAAGNESLPAVTIVDTIAPGIPTIAATNGSVLSGSAEAGSSVILTTLSGASIGETTADANGTWTFTPTTNLANGTPVEVVARDAAGNTSLAAGTVVDSIPPASPVLVLQAGGATLSGNAEPESLVRIVIGGDTANPVTVTADGNGQFSIPLVPALTAGETVNAIAIDAAGNQSAPASIVAPDLAPPLVEVPEAADGWVNAAEAGDGIQVEVVVRPTMQVGQVVTATLHGQGGYLAQATHSLTAGDLVAGIVLLSIMPTTAFPQGAANVTASVGAGASSAPVDFVIDTVTPSTPILSLNSSLLTISAEAGSEVVVSAIVGGHSAGATVVANSAGIATVNLLTGLDANLDWAQLLDAQVSVTSQDAAGNSSGLATLAVGPAIAQPVTIHDLGLAVSLNPLSPQFGISGTTDPSSTVAVRVVTPALNVMLLPISADSSGHFTLNLLSPTVLTQLGLSVTDILNLGSQISLGLVATDPQGHQSASYGLSLSPAGLSLGIGQIDVNGTLADDIMSGSTGAEHINGNAGNDLILNVGTGDHVSAGPGNDTIQITATNFSTIDGGTGFDTLLLANGIDLDYGPGVGTLTSIERIDLGTGDSGSVLTLTASEVTAITDAGHTLQITGEGNDVLNIVGATSSGMTQVHDGLVYDVYTFGGTTVLVEDSTVQVVV